jgi:hypothetical protein
MQEKVDPGWRINLLGYIFVLGVLRLGRRRLICSSLAVEARGGQPGRHGFVIRDAHSHHQHQRRDGARTTPIPFRTHDVCRLVIVSLYPLLQTIRPLLCWSIRSAKDHQCGNALLHEQIMIRSIEGLRFRHRIGNHLNPASRRDFIHNSAHCGMLRTITNHNFHRTIYTCLMSQVGFLTQ